MAIPAQKLKQNDPVIDIDDFRAKILDWYKLNAREMPWRAAFGQFPEPYHEWLSEIMLQQTVVKAVIPYFLKFISFWPSVHDLARAKEEDVLKEWAGLGYYARARNLHKCAKVISTEYGGVFPAEEEELKKLPGIGPYTAAAISSIAFGRAASVMDGNVERVMARLFAHPMPLRESKAVLYEYTHSLSAERTDNPGDYAQAVMELGATVCTPQQPKCALCPVRMYCRAYQQGAQQDIPVKAKKVQKPTRYGILYFIENAHGDLLFEKRPKKGLFSGMNGLPGSQWTNDRFDEGETLPGYEIRHTFTHFHLILQGRKVDITDYPHEPDNHFWYKVTDYDRIGLPSLYKKAIIQYIR